nr:probable sulfate transporter 3.4 [Tanacetum cinerariifolium]
MKIKLSAEVTNYLLGSSSNATFTMVSHEKARAIKITTTAYRLMAALWEILEKTEAYTDTKMANMEWKKTLADSCYEENDEGINYAKLANFSPILRLYLSFVPLVIYFVLGSLRHLAVGPVSIASLVMGEMLNEAVPYAQDPVLYFKLAFDATLLQPSFNRI